MEKQVIKWAAINEEKSGADRRGKMRAEIERLEYIDLSDCLTNRERGSSAFLEILDDVAGKEAAKGKPRMYKLRIIRDPWGEPPKQGDVFRWKQQLVTEIDGKPLTSRDMEAMKRRGDGHRLVEMGEAIVDEYGCIEIPYRDAANLLYNNGQHYEHKTGVCDRKEVSTKPTLIDGNVEQKKYRWNWLYEECPPWWKLDKLKAKPGPKPKATE